ncbi:MAG: 50S ribosomal protein L19 [Candidatus Caldatribacteriota bacterium]|nr:50S ribosomal protein L19 [Candidatus Caldatribacteriota bacterium]
MIDYISKLEKEQAREGNNQFKSGDTVEVHQKIVEGKRERIQVFKGIVIAKKHSGTKESFTVRKISKGVGVEKIFQLHSPNIKKIVVLKKGKVRRAKLYYLRGRVGKRSVVKEKR